MKIAVVTPVFNEERHLSNLIKNTKKFRLPIVVVDDGSTDGSLKKSSEKNVTYMRHKINLGKGAAMKTGADWAFNNGFDSVIFMDSDGQHNPGNLGLFIKKLESKKFDIIFGSRKLSSKTPFVRLYGNKFARLVVKILFNIQLSDLLCGFRAITRDGYKKIRWESVGYGVEIEMLARCAREKLSYSEIIVDTIYHDTNKGVTIMDAFGVFANVIQWRLTI